MFSKRIVFILGAIGIALLFASFHSHAEATGSGMGGGMTMMSVGGSLLPIAALDFSIACLFLVERANYRSRRRNPLLRKVATGVGLSLVAIFLLAASGCGGYHRMMKGYPSPGMPAAPPRSSPMP